MFAKKLIIVAGAAGNVGAALAKLLASRGASVVAVDTMRSRLDAVVGWLEGSGHLGLSDYELTDFTSSAALTPNRKLFTAGWTPSAQRSVVSPWHDLKMQGRTSGTGCST